MKAKNLLAIALIATLGFTACSNDEEPTIGASGDIVQINGSVNGPKAKAVIDDNTGEGSFENDDVWGMYATVGGSYVLNNSTYTVGSTTLYWSNLSETALVTFAAHYPRITATIADPAAYVFNAATATNPDLLVATPVTKSKGEEVDLTFNHMMHQLLITLDKDPVKIPESLLDAEVTLLNMKSSAKVNLLTGVVDASTASGTDAYPVKEGAAIFITAPQQLTAGTDWIKIELAGKTYTFKVPVGLTELQSGKRVTLALTLTKKPDGTTAVTLTNQGISAWNNQMPTIDGDANEN